LFSHRSFYVYDRKNESKIRFLSILRDAVVMRRRHILVTFFALEFWVRIKTEKRNGKEEESMRKRRSQSSLTVRQTPERE
jgi:hypothetical protein